MLSLAAYGWFPHLLLWPGIDLVLKRKRQKKKVFDGGRGNLYEKSQMEMSFREVTAIVGEQRATAERDLSLKEKQRAERNCQERNGGDWEDRGRKEWIYSSGVMKEQRAHLWCFSISTVTMDSITSLWLTKETGMNGSNMPHCVAIIITESIYYTVVNPVLIANWSPRSNLSDNSRNPV